MRVSIERVLGDEDVAAFYPTYVQAWEPLLTRAAARHLLSEEEFAKEMSDPRIEKFLVREGRTNRPVALTTLTTDLAAVEWINPSFYRARYPEAAARDALFYLGYTLVDRTRRRSNALLLMASEINRRVASVRGVVGYDICGYNDAHGIGRYTELLFGSSNSVGRLDTQTYYAADYRRLDAPEPTRDDAEDDGPAGDLTTVTLAERPDLVDDIAGVLALRWPTFMLAARPGHAVDLDELVLDVPQHQVIALDESGKVQGVGLSVPLGWDGTPDGLPLGWDDAVAQSAELTAAGRTPDAVSALSVTVTPEASGQGVAARIVLGLREAAGRAGATSLIAPIRPILKSRYPLVPMETYLEWRTPAGEPYDPWVRLHLRLGARMLGVAPDSMTLSGTVQEWRRWTDLELPGPGTFVLPGALAPLEVNGGIGTYVEPNVWVVHTVPPVD